MAKGLTLKPVVRVFKYGSLEIPDPNPSASPEQVKTMLSARYPDLTNSGVEGPEFHGDKQAYTFNRAIGTKG
jgi:PRTRC genetic system protein C